MLITYILIAIVILLSILLYDLLKKNNQQEKPIPKPSLIDRLGTVRYYKNPEHQLDGLIYVSKDLFFEKFKLSRNLSYSEIENEMRKKKLTEYAMFCSEMSEILYQGKKATREKILNLINQLEWLMMARTDILLKQKETERKDRNLHEKLNCKKEELTKRIETLGQRPKSKINNRNQNNKQPQPPQK